MPQAMSLNFEKWHGLGNDFVMLTQANLQQAGIDYTNSSTMADLAKTLCHRQFGIGADGLIIAVLPSQGVQAQIRFAYWNSDGSVAEMCGNGIRCFAQFAAQKGLVQGDTFATETAIGVLHPKLLPNGWVEVDMGAPILDPAAIPTSLPSSNTPAVNIAIQHNDQTVHATLVSMGNPHCVLFNTNLDPAEWGPILEHHPLFTAKTNVEFAQCVDKENINLVVWERGCGFTLACGTGACATVVAGVLNGLCNPSVKVSLPGGTLHITWQQETQHVLMQGPATKVYSGTWCGGLGF